MLPPLGWSYCNQSNNEFELSLWEFLLSVSNRNQTVPVDGIYCILGLLPYGSEISINYKDKVCRKYKVTEQRSQKPLICNHLAEEKTEYPAYFQSDLKDIFHEVFKMTWKREVCNNLLRWHDQGIMI